MADYVFFHEARVYRAAVRRFWCRRLPPWERPGRVQPTLAKALKGAKRMAHREDLILITGSLFTVGETMAVLDPETYKPDPIR